MSGERIPEGSFNFGDSGLSEEEARKILRDLFKDSASESPITDQVVATASKIGKSFKEFIVENYPWDEEEAVAKYVGFAAMYYTSKYLYKRGGAPKWAARGLASLTLYAYLANEWLKQIEKNTRPA